MPTVKAIQITSTGGPEQMSLVDIEVGDPGRDEVRIRHEACGINFLDTYHRSGLYPLPLPTGIGVEAAGVIDAIGDGVQHLSVGDRVAYTARTPGSYSEMRVVPAFLVARLPDAIGTDAAAAMMLKGMTAQFLLRRTRHALAPGDFLVWHAAAGGVGLIACQWARALGFRMIATASTPEKRELALAHGAEHAVEYADVVGLVRKLTGKGVKAVFDSVGKDTFEQSLDCLAPLGLLVSFGNASGPPPPLVLQTLSAKGSLYVTRPTLYAHLTSIETAREMTGELFEMVTAGKVVIPVERRYPLADAARAHRELEGRETTGAGILIP